MRLAAPGTLLVDLSPTTPTFARELSAVALVHELAMAEAPLVVDDMTAADALGNRDNTACLVAGEKEHVEAARPLLEAFVGRVERVGDAGAAALARAALTLQITAQIVAAVEADALFYAVQGAASSVDRIEGRPGAVSPMAARVLEAIEHDGFEGSYTVEMLMAELAAAMSAADDVDLILPQAEAVVHLLEILAVIGGADSSPTALSLLYREEDAASAYGLDWSRVEEYYDAGASHPTSEGTAAEEAEAASYAAERMPGPVLGDEDFDEGDEYLDEDEGDGCDEDDA